MQVKKQKHHYEPNMEQQTGSKLGKGCVKAVYCHPSYIQSTNAGLDEAQVGIKISKRNINNNLKYAEDTMLMAES